MSKIDYQVLREAAVAIETVATPQKLLAFRMKVTPQVVLALLDELEAKDKRIADMEAREVVLPRAHDVHPLGPQSAKIFCEFHRSIVNRCSDEIRKVGVKVSIKGN
ncbi:TPA: ead/Ea22-like family protein [Escherichia coli]|nr:ead/Ea22-like family protein [Escherichia coli]